MTRIAVFCLGLAIVASAADRAAAQQAKPNIVHIFADDLGWGSVGFNGQEQIETPNLDELAMQGMVLNNSYAATLCAPSRSMLYTGFHQGHGIVDSNGKIGAGFRAQDVMTPQVLAGAGYRSAIFGKWGFGASGGRTIGPAADPQPQITNVQSLPTQHGYEEFYGYLNHGAAHDYYYDWMWQSDAAATNGVSLDQNDGAPGGEPEYTHDLFAAKSEAYIQQHAGDADPFYLQINYTIPHSNLLAIEDAPGGFAQYADKPWTPAQKAYAAMISRMDASIGQVVGKLDDPNGDGDKSDSVLENTLILFSTDNGPTTADNAPLEFFDANGIYRGGKRDLFEGGIHVPSLAYWKGTIAPGQTSDYRTDLTDFMATAADLAGVETPVGIDGVSILPTLTGAGRQRVREYLVFEHHEQDGPDPDSRDASWAVVRQDGKKLIRYDDLSFDLFDLAADPSESTPLNLNVPAYAQLKAELEAAALAEGVQQGTVEYRTWAGADGADLGSPTNWSPGAAASSYWSAVAANAAAGDKSAIVSTNFATLGFEVRGNAGGMQTVEVPANRTLAGRNEVRISAGGRLALADGAVETNRWINVRAGGQLVGVGQTTGDVYNLGAVAPGWSPDFGPPTPQDNVDTGPVTAVQFNFAGVQDAAPLTQTTVLNPHATLAHGLDFGPGVSPRNAANAGNEFNVQGFVVGGSLQNAIDNNDYLTFTLAPAEETSLTPHSVSFNLWRNGSGAAQDYAILSSVDGFTASDAIAQIHIADSGSANQHLFTANFIGGQPQTEPIEVRLYGWNATGASGNTHVNAVSMQGRFTSAGGGETLGPVGRLAVDGDFYHLPGGSLHIELGGLAPATQHDVIEVDGAVELAGELHVSLADLGGPTFTPVRGNEFVILTAAGGLSGQFAAVELPTLDEGLDWLVDYSATTVTLRVLASADFDQDGDVDGDDLSDWRNGVGADNPSKQNGDADRDGTVDGADFLSWQRQLGGPPGATAAVIATPEPSSVALLATAALAAAAAHNIHRK